MRSAREWHFKGSGHSGVTKRTILSARAAALWCLKGQQTACPGGIKAGSGGKRVEGRGGEEAFNTPRLCKQCDPPQREWGPWGSCLLSPLPGKMRELGQGGKDVQHDSSTLVWRLEQESVRYSRRESLRPLVSRDLVVPILSEGKSEASGLWGWSSWRSWAKLAWEGALAESLDYLPVAQRKKMNHPTVCPLKQLLRITFL